MSFGGRLETLDMSALLQTLSVGVANGRLTEGGGRIRLSVGCDGTEVAVNVEDSGVGVPADRLEQVFEAFVTSKLHGLGLGLAICRSIVQSHGGRIGCKINTSRGVTFWFTLPAAAKVGV